MPVIGMVIRNITASKDAEIEGAVKVNNTTNLKDVRETELPALGKKGLAVEFEFRAGYESEKLKRSFAEIAISGEVLLVEPRHEELLKVWKKDRKLPDETNIAIINAILRRCITKTLALSEDLNLPPPVALPFATTRKPEESRYIG